MTTRSDLQFDVVMSIKYHRRRAAFLERVGALMSAAILFGGAGAFASLFGEQTGIAKWLTAILALIGIVQIVFQVDRCAAEHRGWLRRWMDLQKEIERTKSPTDERMADWLDVKLDIESECVGEMRALQEDCYNRTISELDRAGEPTPIKLRHRLFMQVYSFENGFQRA